MAGSTPNLVSAGRLLLLLASLGTSPAAMAANPPAQETNDMLAAASVNNGHELSLFCGSCHTFDKGGPNTVGPNLYGIVGAKTASNPTYHYSMALQKLKNRTWTVDNLDTWLKTPGAYAPGTTMAFGGMLDPQDRDDLIAYLQTLKDKSHPSTGSQSPTPPQNH